jgi:predicted RNA-binding Zn ribbon-like protein
MSIGDTINVSDFLHRGWKMSGQHSDKVPITPELQETILRLHHDWPGGWRDFPDKVEGWPASWGLAQQIAEGRIKRTDVKIYEVLELAPPATAISVDCPVGYDAARLTEDLVILSRAEVRVCLNPECNAQFSAIGNRKWCTTHDYQSGWQNTATGRRVRSQVRER